MTGAHVDTPMGVAEYIDWVRAIRRRVRLESGRSDGRCGKVSEAIEAELGWAYRWGHLRLLDGGVCWIHCWNELPDGTVVDATADQFEERWLGDVAVLSPGEPLYSSYRSAPPGHLFHTVRVDRCVRLTARCTVSDGMFGTAEEQIADAADTPEGWSKLGSRALEVHTRWTLPEWMGRAAGERLREAAASEEPLPSRELEFAMDAKDRERWIAHHGEWTSPEWRDVQRARETG